MEATEALDDPGLLLRDEFNDLETHFQDIDIRHLRYLKVEVLDEDDNIHGCSNSYGLSENYAFVPEEEGSRWFY